MSFIAEVFSTIILNFSYSHPIGSVSEVISSMLELILFLSLPQLD